MELYNTAIQYHLVVSTYVPSYDVVYACMMYVVVHLSSAFQLLALALVNIYIVPSDKYNIMLTLKEYHNHKANERMDTTVYCIVQATLGNETAVEYHLKEGSGQECLTAPGPSLLHSHTVHMCIMYCVTDAHKCIYLGH